MKVNLSTYPPIEISTFPMEALRNYFSAQESIESAYLFGSLIHEFMEGNAFEELASNKLLLSGVERQVEIIGEAANHLSEEICRCLCPPKQLRFGYFSRILPSFVRTQTRAAES